MTPLQWFHDLSNSISASRCKIAGTDHDFESGLATAKDLFLKTRAAKGTVYWVGNGGSNAICTHLSQDVLNKLNIASFAINDSSLLTCMSNDFGYENSFSTPLQKLIGSDDLLIAISSSGNSENILNAVKVAQNQKASVIGLSSFKDDNKLHNATTDVSFFLPSNLYGHAEVGHAALLHAVIECLFLEENKG